MVTKVEIKDNKRTPITYLPNLKNFKNGKVYEFKPGVNVIVGENGCGKTTLMNLIKKYLVVDYSECFRGEYNCNINDLFRTFHKEHTQVIAVVHNPLLICALSKKKSINLIEMTDGYIDKVRNEVRNLMK